MTRDDGEALEISTVFAVGEPDDSSASEAFYKDWPLVSCTPLTADDVRDLARRGDTVRTSDFSRFLWEMPDNSSVDYMQFPVYDRMEFGTDTGLYVTMASGGSDTPSSVALYAPDGTLLLDDLRGCDSSALEGWLKYYLPGSVGTSGVRTNEPDRFLFNVLNWPILSSQFPMYVQASGPVLWDDLIIPSRDFGSLVKPYFDRMQFREDIAERPQIAPSVCLTYSDTSFLILLYERQDFFLVQRGSTWGCYSVPSGFYNAIVKYVCTSGVPHVSFTDEEIQAAEQAAREYFSAEAPARELNALWYDDARCQWMRLTYLKNGRGAENGVNPQNVLVLLCDFTIDGEEHPDWSLIFIRDSAQAAWRLDDQGY